MQKMHFMHKVQALKQMIIRANRVVARDQTLLNINVFTIVSLISLIQMLSLAFKPDPVLDDDKLSVFVFSTKKGRN